MKHPEMPKKVRVGENGDEEKDMTRIRKVLPLAWHETSRKQKLLKIAQAAQKSSCFQRVGCRGEEFRRQKNLDGQINTTKSPRGCEARRD